MSTSNTSATYALKISVDDEYKYLVKISLFDSDNRIISPIEKSRNSYSFQLNKGLYTLRVEMNAAVNDTIISVKSDQEYLVSTTIANNTNTISIEPPKQFSSALLHGEHQKTYTSSHEYYTYPAIHFSTKDTFSLDGFNANDFDSSLFIFMRFPSFEKYNELQNHWSKSFYQDFEIVNEEGELIIQFESRNGLEIDENHGWFAFNAKLPNGIYYLIYRGAEPRQIPIYVFKNWHTQFFMTLGDTPLLVQHEFLSPNKENLTQMQQPINTSISF